MAPDTVAEGRDGGDAALADADSYANFVRAEYIWVDVNGRVRSAAKTLSARPLNEDDCPIWSFDGSSTGQAEQDNSDCYLVPRKVFDDPIRQRPHVLVLAEAIASNMEPCPGNYRQDCNTIFAKYDKKGVDCHWTLKQEYMMMEKTAMGEKATDGNVWRLKGTQRLGVYYGGVGSNFVVTDLRDLMGDHYASCLYAGVKLKASEIGQAVSQAAFTVGPCKGTEIADHLIVARYILHVLSEKHRYYVTFDPRPDAENDGNGLEIGVSSAMSRAEGGLQWLERACRVAGRKHKEFISLSGDGNVERRLDGQDGLHRDKFSFGVSDKGASIYIPRSSAVMGKGEMIDRRAGANACPYRVVGHLFSVIGPQMKLEADNKEARNAAFKEKEAAMNGGK